MPSDEKKWPEASNYEEAERLRRAYTDALVRLHEPTADESDTIAWRLVIYRQRNAEALLTLANMHATLAVADELAKSRELMRRPH